ncbi:MAG: hypothetical protein A4E57_04295 [Syntrophorhabdaceae bacterium PtaU1.Bin034]|nr:MAG: hypothetical protein A4E57_04295 [Syntrophorhabdaceae bacterium PtaU1.Bin034]
MSKSKKGKSTKAENPHQLTTEVLEQRTKNDLDLQNYRRAKEWLKELSRRDKAKYLPRLIDCYNHLARQMLEKGQTSEAKTVFDQIRTLTGGGADFLSEIVLARSSGDYRRAADAAISHCSRDGSLTGEDGRLVADVFVLAFEDLPRLKETDPQLYSELAAIHKALEHVSSMRFSEALDELKKIGLRSVFAGWRLFVKGLCAFYEGRDAKALDTFRHLGEDSQIYRAARPFMFVIDRASVRTPADESKELLFRQVCTAMNKPDLAPALARAEYLWHYGRHTDSYEYAAKTLPGFPTETPGLLHTLSLFYFNASSHMDISRADKYLRGIHHMIGRKKEPSVDHILFMRARNLHLDRLGWMVRDEDYLGLWEEFLRDYRRLYGGNDKVSALVYAYLGGIFSEQAADDSPRYLFRRRKPKAKLRNRRLAEEAYRKSLNLNKGDKDVHLALLELYKLTGEKSKRNRVLDEISRLFPDDKDILAQNGNFCIERKAFIKGIEYLRRAVALDRLDHTVKEALSIAYIKAGLHFAREGNVQRCRALMYEAIAAGQPGLANMNLSRPYLRARLAAFEWIMGNEREGDRSMEEAVRETGNEQRIVYFTYLIGRAYGIGETYVARLKKRVKAAFQHPEPAEAAAFTEILSYVDIIPLAKPWISAEFDRLNQYAGEAAAKECTPLEAEKIVRYALGQKGAGKAFGPKYIRKVLDEDPRNPLFLYFRYLYNTSGGTMSPTTDNLQKLKEILSIATERNERLLMETLHREIREVEADLSSPSGYYDYDADDDEWGDDIDDEEFERFVGEAEEFLAGGPSRKPDGRHRKKAGNVGQEPLFNDFK